MLRSSGRKFAPPTDIIELSDKIVVLVEIAGMRVEDFNLALFNRNLVITGVRERPNFTKPAYHQVEIGVGHFRLEIQLPIPVDTNSVSARYYDGFLQIDLPRRAEKQIRITNVEQQDEI